ncbi:MAG: porin [Ferruginibacter sp.]
MIRKILPILSVLFFLSQLANAQQAKETNDSSVLSNKTLLSFFNKFNNLTISGYIQPEFQVIQQKGAHSFGGGDFEPNSSKRFKIRRGRIKFNYTKLNKSNYKTIDIVFQPDITEKGVVLRDLYGAIYENKFNLFSLTIGMMNRPFSHEVIYSSSKRESPERGRVTQTLMKDERDLGAKITFAPQRKDHPLHNLSWDLGFYNGPGLANSTDFDNYKDLISRMTYTKIPLGKKLELSAGISYFNGGFIQRTKYINRQETVNNIKKYVTDSSLSNIDSKAPRKYIEADFNLKFKQKAGITELRAELWAGKQTATEFNSATPAAIPMSGNVPSPLYIRNFNAAIFYFLHNFINSKHQLAVKYDWYDPNSKVTASDIGKPGSNLTEADIKYSTLAFGYAYTFNEHAKIVFWYDIVNNEKTQLAGYTKDLKDNLFTCRLQFKF